MITDVLLGLILAALLVSTAWLVTRMDVLREDISDVERLLRRMADELDLDED